MNQNQKNEVWLPCLLDKNYEVSNLGYVRSVDRKYKVKNRWGQFVFRKKKGKLLKPISNGNGYFYAVLGLRKKIAIHRLVLISFTGKDNRSLDVNHVNGIKNDNRLENLEWCTRKKNMEHAVANGMMASGERHYKSKISTNEIKEIRKSKLNNSVLAKRYSVKPECIRRIKLGLRRANG